jgi:hypothetical protein
MTTTDAHPPTPAADTEARAAGHATARADRAETTVAIVGAGLSGLVCARVLQQAGLRVRLFDKSRGPGGRLATRRSDDGEFDHGAQYFTARDPRFRAMVDDWLARGAAARWDPALVALDRTEGGTVRRSAVGDGTIRFVGVPTMNRVARLLAEGLDLHAGHTLTGAHRTEAQGRAGWTLEAVDGDGKPLPVDGRFDWLVTAMPSPQARTLLADAPVLQAQADALPMVPCWAVLATFDAPLATGFDAAFVNGSSLTWIARNGARPGRPRQPECWVLHAARDWSEACLESSPDEACARMLEEFRAVTGCHDRPRTARAHRWRYSGPGAKSDLPCLFDATRQAGACGDWLAGSRVEGACLSGLALAERILAARP